MEVVVDVNELNASVGKNEDVADGEMDSLEGIPEFKPIKTVPIGTGSQYRSVPVPPNRMSPLKKQWNEIFTPLVSHMNLQVRMNLKRRCVEIRGSPKTEDSGSVQKGADFVSAFISGFEIKDAIALLRLEDIYVESFDIKDVKFLHGEHLSRAIGRVAGQGGKTKFTIENATKTRIVLADTKVHILGSFSNIKLARSAIARLLRGSPPGKVYTQMRAVSSRMKQRF